MDVQPNKVMEGEQVHPYFYLNGCNLKKSPHVFTITTRNQDTDLLRTAQPHTSEQLCTQLTKATLQGNTSYLKFHHHMLHRTEKKLSSIMTPTGNTYIIINIILIINKL